MKKLNINFTEKNRRIPALFIVIAVILVIIAGITFARYVLNEEHSGVAEAEAFYFTSDLLKEETENKVYHIDPATENFEVTLSNAEDAKRVTKSNIQFSVEVTGGTATGGTVFTIAGNEKREQKITITPDSGVEMVKVKVTSDSPYKKTLQADFKLESGNVYKVEDEAGKRAAVLTITCVKAPSDSGITVMVPDNIVPDATNTLLTKNADNNYKFAPTDAGVYSLVLLKRNESDNISMPEQGFSDKIEVKAATTTTP